MSRHYYYDWVMGCHFVALVLSSLAADQQAVARPAPPLVLGTPCC